MKKKMIAVLVLAVLFFGSMMYLIFGLQNNKAQPNRTLNAKVRYFDGECEMIELDSFGVYSDALVKLVTKAGDVMYIGPNNVIILNEEAGI